MRRGGRILMAALCALAVLSGCGGPPPGVDGDLVNNWPAFAEAVTPTPVANVCYSTEYTETWIGEFDGRTTSCTGTHKTETVAVGTFTGPLAARSTPPLKFSTDLANAYKDCAKQADQYLGGPWQSGYLWLGLTLPSTAAWTGGARWYRCELIGLSKDMREDSTTLSTSLKGGLTGSRPAARGCLMVQVNSGGSITKEDGIDCAQPHNGEYAGLYTLHGSYQTDQTKRWQLESDGCRSVYTSFLGVSPSNNRYFGWLYHDISAEEWNLGIRTGICGVLGFSGSSPNNVRFTGSVKGIGTRKPTGWKA